MAQEQVGYVYEPFAETDEYKQINARIIRQWVDTLVESGTRRIERVLDIATGVGTMVQLFLEHLPASWAQPRVTCVDQSEEALEKTRERLGPRVEHLELIQSPVEELELEEGSVDVALWGNGIHYLSKEAQQEALRNVRRSMKSGGWLFFNSAFYEGSRPEDTLPFYKSQIANAVRDLRSRGIQREKKEGRPAASSFLPLSHYQTMLQNAGFQVQEMKRMATRLYQSAWEKISGFSQYAAGALHGYRPDLAAEALRKAVEPSIRQHGYRDANGKLYVPRNWLSAMARA